MTLPAMKLRLPTPLAPKPMAGLELVQAYVKPGSPVKTTETLAPAQAAKLPGLFIIGLLMTAMLKVCGEPEQPLAIGMTVTIALPGLVVVKLILPEPEAAKPILALALIHVNVAPLVAEN